MKRGITKQKRGNEKEIGGKEDIGGEKKLEESGKKRREEIKGGGNGRRKREKRNGGKKEMEILSILARLLQISLTRKISFIDAIFVAMQISLLLVAGGGGELP